MYIYECIKDFITTDEEEDQEEEDSDRKYCSLQKQAHVIF